MSIVIPFYGDPARTMPLIDALKSQSTDFDTEIIIADDESPLPFPTTAGVTVTRRVRNGGFGSAVNAGAALARFDHLLVLNSDVVIEDGFLASLHEAAEPLMPAVISPDVVDEHGHPHSTARHYPRLRHHLTIALSPLARFRSTNAWREAVGHDTRARSGEVLGVDWVVGAVMLLPTAEFRAVHGFDEGFYMNSEEIDLQRRLRRRGVPSIYLGTVSIEHEGGGSSDSSKRRGWVVAGTLQYSRKWGGRPLEFAHRMVLTGASLANFGVNAGRRVLGRDLAPRHIFKTEVHHAWQPLPHSGRESL